MRGLSAIGCLLAGLALVGAARADRVVGIAGIAPPQSSAARAVQAPPAMQSGIVTAVDVQGARVRIDDRWYVLKRGRSLVLKKSLPSTPEALAVGQRLRFTLASAVPGEQALGVVHVP